MCALPMPTSTVNAFWQLIALVWAASAESWTVSAQMHDGVATKATNVDEDGLCEHPATGKDMSLLQVNTLHGVGVASDESRAGGAHASPASDIAGTTTFPDSVEYFYDYDDSALYGPAHWPVFFAQCGDGQQSPIFAPTAQTADANFDAPLKLENTVVDELFSAHENNQLYVGFATAGGAGWVSPVWDTQVSLSGGPLTEAYTLQYLALSWGPTKYEPITLQLIFHSAQSGKRAVVEVEYEHTSSGYNAVVQKFIPYLGTVRATSKSLTLNGGKVYKFPSGVTSGGFDVSQLVPSSGKYITYEGSLAQPPCSPATWIRFLDKPKMSFGQAAQIRNGAYNLKNERVSNSYRPNQQTLPDTVVYAGEWHP